MRKRNENERPPTSPREVAPIDPAPHIIVSNAIYTVGSASRALGLPKSSLPREIRQGRLRVAKRAGRYFIMGTWLLEWLQSGERQRAGEEKTGSKRDMR